MNARSAAIETALNLHPLTDAAEWIAWVQSTDELTEAERDLVLTAGADDLRATAARIEAEADQLAARVAAIDEFLARLARYPVADFETIGALLDEVRSEDPTEHRRLVALAALAFPDGTVTVAEEAAT